jgi:O-antigen ligase
VARTTPVRSAAGGLGDIRPAGRSGDSVSLSDNLARVVAPIDLELAKELSPNAAWHAGTAEWRALWWKEIWLYAHSTPMLEAFGHGYGFDLFGLAPEEVRAGQEGWDVRTPHSVFLYALGYTGWVGVALFGLLQIAILRLPWQSYRVGGQPAGVVFWVMGVAMASFEPWFDTPYHAISFYLLMGKSIAPELQWRDALDARAAPAQLLPVAGQ